MTARTRKGYKGHSTHGADHKTAHSRLMAAHTMGARPEGAMMSAPAMGAPGPAMVAPGPAMGAAPPDAGGPAMGMPPMSDTTEGDQS